MRAYLLITLHINEILNKINNRILTMLVKFYRIGILNF